MKYIICRAALHNNFLCVSLETGPTSTFWCRFQSNMSNCQHWQLVTYRSSTVCFNFLTQDVFFISQQTTSAKWSMVKRKKDGRWSEGSGWHFSIPMFWAFQLFCLLCSWAVCCVSDKSELRCTGKSALERPLMTEFLVVKSRRIHLPLLREVVVCHIIMAWTCALYMVNSQQVHLSACNENNVCCQSKLSTGWWSLKTINGSYLLCTKLLQDNVTRFPPLFCSGLPKGLVTTFCSGSQKIYSKPLAPMKTKSRILKPFI